MDSPVAGPGGKGKRSALMVGALGLGVMAGALSLPHDGREPFYTVIGVAIVALGHQLNRIAAE